MSLNDRTLNFYKGAKMDNRKKEGQYMTPTNIVDLLIDVIQFDKNDLILEPSYGTGQFLDKLKTINKPNKQIKIYAIEKDKELFDLSKDDYTAGYNKFNLFNEDYLTKSFNTKFDKIIGNPPYFEIDCTPELKKLFDSVIGGRPNIYSFFLKKGIDELKDNGILSFVIPTSLLSSKYFEKTRDYIVKYCNIERITKLTSDLFEDALQMTMIFQIKKRVKNEKSDKKFIVDFNKSFIFSEDYTNINNFLNDKKFIVDMGCIVKTGSIVWNQFRDKYPDHFTNDSKTNNKDNIPLIYPRNLKDGKLTLQIDDKKPQYIKNTINIQPMNGPIIAINRIIGINNITFNPVLIEKGSYFFENHINTISGKLEDLKKIVNSLNSSQTVDFIKKIIGNTQLSKSELETMIPIFDNDADTDTDLKDNELESDIDTDDQLDEDDYMNF